MKIEKKEKPKLTSLDPDSPEPFRFGEYPLYYIGQIQRQNFSNLSEALRPFSLIPLEWRALAQLQERDGISISELAGIIISERSALSRVVGAMEKKGFLRRAPDGEDQRVTLVYITELGLELFKQLLPIVRKHLAWTLGGFSEKEKADLMSLLVKLQSNVLRSPFA